MVAYELGVHGIDVRRAGRHARRPASRSAPTPCPPGPLVAKLTDGRYRLVAAQRALARGHGAARRRRGRACPAGGPDAPRVPPRPQTPELTSSR